jgi:hypothetical protein
MGGFTIREMLQRSFFAGMCLVRFYELLPAYRAGPHV